MFSFMFVIRKLPVLEIVTEYIVKFQLVDAKTVTSMIKHLKYYQPNNWHIYTMIPLKPVAR